jgi:hypothetical protein
MFQQDPSRKNIYCVPQPKDELKDELVLIVSRKNSLCANLQEISLVETARLEKNNSTGGGGGGGEVYF